MIDSIHSFILFLLRFRSCLKVHGVEATLEISPWMTFGSSKVLVRAMAMSSFDRHKWHINGSVSATPYSSNRRKGKLTQPDVTPSISKRTVLSLKQTTRRPVTEKSWSGIQGWAKASWSRNTSYIIIIACRYLAFAFVVVASISNRLLIVVRFLIYFLKPFWKYLKQEISLPVLVQGQ